MDDAVDQSPLDVAAGRYATVEAWLPYQPVPHNWLDVLAFDKYVKYREINPDTVGVAFGPMLTYEDAMTIMIDDDGEAERRALTMISAGGERAVAVMMFMALVKCARQMLDSPMFMIGFAGNKLSIFSAAPGKKSASRRTSLGDGNAMLCGNCNMPGVTQRCPCRGDLYCDAACQKAHFRAHKISANHVRWAAAPSPEERKFCEDMMRILQKVGGSITAEKAMEMLPPDTPPDIMKMIESSREWINANGGLKLGPKIVSAKRKAKAARRVLRKMEREQGEKR
jgi:hypothetical protein